MSTSGTHDAPGTAAVGADRAVSSSTPSAPWRAVLGYWLLRYRRIWRSTVISSFLAPLLYLAGLGYGLGALLDSPGRTAVDGIAYVAFVATGLVSAQTMMSGSSEATYNVLGSIKWSFTYQAMISTPIDAADVVRGHLAYILIRVTMVATVFTGVATALGAMRGWWVLAVVPVAALCGMGFATCTFAYSASISSDYGFNVLQRFVLMPMFLFSGTFFPLEQLPGPLQALAWASPLTHAVALTRALGLGPDSPLWLPHWRFATHLAVLGVMASLGYVLSVRRLRRRMVV